ncbi:MAG: PBP1A family penicillin-binding protein [Deltaproteobacteria bacterium]|nr:PBP1A family penicillin-binding protein [Deltaproteobacteria bacterium]
MKKRTKKQKRTRQSRLGRWLRLGLLAIALLAIAALALQFYVLERRLDERLQAGFGQGGPRFYTDRLRIVPGLDLERAGVLDRIERLRYRRDPDLADPGTWRQRKGVIEIYLRGFTDPQGSIPARLAVIENEGGRVRRIVDRNDGAERRQATLEPLMLDVTWNGSWQARRPVRLAKLPPHVPEAVLAAEDARFYHHPGIDLIGVLRAMVVNLRAGEIREGASTITQQLAKNLFLTPERAWRRKAKEAILAWMIEDRLTKKEILEWYLNEVYLGRDGAASIVGVGQAASSFFDKQASELTIAEAATIASVISAPNPNSPLRAPERARKRRDRVIRNMGEAGFITAAQASAEAKSPLRVAIGGRATLEAPFFLAQALREAGALLGRDTLSGDPLDIYTTLDVSMQAASESAVRQSLARLETDHPFLKKGEAPLEGALAIVGTRDGAVAALVGGRDFSRRPFDRAATASRQSGSTFKPFVYLAAFESHPRDLTPSSPLEDAPVSVRASGKIWQPANYDGRFRGTVTVRYALERSLNVPTVRLAQRTGIADVARTAAAAGWGGDLPRVPALALGVAETSLVDLAGAYTVFPMLGTAVKPHLLWGVTDAGGNVIARRAVETHAVADPRATYLVHHILEGVVDRGTARSLRARGFTRPLAGKTGTTNDYRDAWFVGYTPDLVAAAWVGYDDGRPMRLPSSSTALPLWASAMGPILDSRPPLSFTVPSGISFRRVDPQSGLLPARECPATILEAFVEGTEPRVDCRRRSDLRTARAPAPTPDTEVERVMNNWVNKIFGIFR